MLKPKRRSDGRLKMRNIWIKCQNCGAENEYTPIEYEGEVVVCKSCKTSMPWESIFYSLSESDKRKVMMSRYLSSFLKGIVDTGQ